VGCNGRQDDGKIDKRHHKQRLEDFEEKHRRQEFVNLPLSRRPKEEKIIKSNQLSNSVLSNWLVF